jgi:hypothetical protein
MVYRIGCFQHKANSVNPVKNLFLVLYMMRVIQG